jgi:hypothetical protein
VNTKIWTSWLAWFCRVFWVKRVANHFHRLPLAAYRKSVLGFYFGCFARGVGVTSFSFAFSWWLMILNILSHFCSQLSVAVPKYLRGTIFKEERFILAHDFRGFSPSSLTPLLWGWVRQNFTITEVYGNRSCPPHDSQEAEARGRKR